MKKRSIVNDIDIFSNHKLKRKDDLDVLIDASLRSERALLDELSFTAKYTMGLKRVLEKGTREPEITNLAQIKTDYSNSIKKSVVQMEEILSHSPQDIQDYFRQTYFELTHSSFQNLNELLKDLEWTKIYFNNQRRKT